MNIAKQSLVGISIFILPVGFQMASGADIQAFYSKVTNFKGLPIKAPACVQDSALVEARRRLSDMLTSNDAVLTNLLDAGCELHIIGAQQVTSDLPEHQHWKGKLFEGKMTIDERTRGVGGRYASCGEENLLHLKGDRYWDRDICTHEFAHTLMEYGLDGALRKRIEEQYQLSKQAGRWPGCYAIKNSGEFWAELSMWYFGSRGDFGKISPTPKEGRQWLESYDPAAYRLLDDIYRGRLQPAREVAERLVPQSAGLEKTLKSQNSNTPMRIRFINQTDKTLRIYWLDFSGERKPYGTIAPHSENDMNTFATHPWLLTDENDLGKVIFVGKMDNNFAFITEERF